MHKIYKIFTKCFLKFIGHFFQTRIFLHIVIQFQLDEIFSLKVKLIFRAIWLRYKMKKKKLLFLLSLWVLKRIKITSIIVTIFIEIILLLLLLLLNYYYYCYCCCYNKSFKETLCLFILLIILILLTNGPTNQILKF